MDSMVAPAAAPGGLPVAPGPGAEWGVEMLGLLPQDGLRYEILDGILLVSPSQVPAHQRVIGRLFPDLFRRLPGGPRGLFRPTRLATGRTDVIATGPDGGGQESDRRARHHREP